MTLSASTILRNDVRWNFATSTERLAYSAVPAEQFSTGYQASDSTFWILLLAPNTWVLLPSGPQIYLDQIADGAVGGGRVVVPTTSGKVGYADKSIAAHANKIVGITRNAASDGASIFVQYTGKMQDSGWTWITNNPIFCGLTGILTQTVPTSGWVTQVAVALSPTEIIVEIKPTLVLS
jgi:hypothetical protein